jgi:hypothetical protein
MNWRCGSNGRAPVLHEFKPQSPKKERKKEMEDV